MEDSQFSQREQEVIDLLIQGKSNKQIALTLHIAQSTVEYHLKNIYEKLDVHSRTEAVLRLGKSIGADPPGELRESIVETNRRDVDNDDKSILLRRFPMNQKRLVIVSVFVLIFSLVAVSILLRMPAQATAPTPTLAETLANLTETNLPTNGSTETLTPTFTPASPPTNTSTATVAPTNTPTLTPTNTATPIPPTIPVKSQLGPNEFLRPNESISSPNGLYTLICQADGNLVLYRYGDRRVVWSSQTAGYSTEYCILQADGNLIVYGPNGLVIWSSQSSGVSPVLELQNDGNLVIYGPGGTVIWSSQSAQP